MTKTEPISTAEVPVLVVGGSLVGLSAAALLAKYGIKCLVVEKHASTAIFPKATVMMPRTMQVFKELGLYDIMREESLKYYDEKTCIITIESLVGKLLHKWQEDVNEGIEEVSATRRVFLTQQALEPLLRAKARELGAELRFSTEMLDFTQDPDGTGVTLTLKNQETNETYQQRTQYMLACDGFRSPTRTELALPMHGPGLLSHALTIYFSILDKEALSKYPNAGYSGVIYVSNPAIRCFFRFDRSKTESFLVINSAGAAGTEASRFPGANNPTEAQAASYLRAAIGDPTIRFRIHQLTTWEARVALPTRLRVQRVFLAGDAAHQMPPSGGFGGNTGVQDAHNLAWKLAAVLRRDAGAPLLDSYERERWPIAKLTVQNALAHYVQRTEPGLEHLLREFDNAAEVPTERLELAYRYPCAAALVAADAGDDEGRPEAPAVGEALVEDPASALARPGSVAHHVCVRVAGGSGLERPVSELFGKGFVLLVGPGGRAWLEALEALGALDAGDNGGGYSAGFVQAVELDFGPERAFAKRYRVRADGAVLVRPDGFVAWSCEALQEGREDAEGCRGVLSAVLDRVLCRGGGGVRDAYTNSLP